MSSGTRQDFESFVAFADAYSLGCIADDIVKAAKLKLAHTQFLAWLTVAAELLASSGSVSSTFYASYGDNGRHYLGEVVSDCSEFVMCVLQGLCRAAGGTLRSGIESYLKTFSALEQPLILNRTSVPAVFDDAAGTAFFGTVVGKRVLTELKGAYGQLNLYVHTATSAQMFGASAIGSFPCWSEKNEELVDLFVRVVRLFSYGLVGSRRDLFDRFDHRNKIIVNRSMTRLQRRSAMGIGE